MIGKWGRLYSKRHRINKFHQPNMNSLESIQQNIKKIKEICLQSRREIEFRTISKWDLEAYWQISDYLTELETLLKNKHEGIDFLQSTFQHEKTSSKWANENSGQNKVKVVYLLNEAGRIALESLDIDIRTRKVQPKDYENYQSISQHLWNIKESLNIQPDKESKFPSKEYRYLNFEFFNGWVEKWGKDAKKSQISMNKLETRHQILQKYLIKSHLDTIISIVDTLLTSEKNRESIVNNARKIQADIAILENDDKELDNYLAQYPLSYPSYEEWIETLGVLVNRLRLQLEDQEWGEGTEKAKDHLFTKFLNWLENERNRDADEETAEEQNFREWEKQIREAFLAGINFVYEMYPFLSDTVDERVRNDDYESFSEVVSEEIGWDEEKWDKEVEKAIAKLINKFHLESWDYEKRQKKLTKNFKN